MLSKPTAVPARVRTPWDEYVLNSYDRGAPALPARAVVPALQSRPAPAQPPG